MEAKTSLRISGTNIAFLLIGILIGTIVLNVSQTISQSVYAQSKENAARTPAACDASRYECVYAEITTPAAGFEVLLANRIAADHLIINGYDLLKIQDSTMKLLQTKGIFNSSDIESIVGAAKVEKPMKLQLSK